MQNQQYEENTLKSKTPQKKSFKIKIKTLEYKKSIAQQTWLNFHDRISKSKTFFNH
jgi:hypothetical protein